jgi:hypothetical protein
MRQMMVLVLLTAAVGCKKKEVEKPMPPAAERTEPTGPEVERPDEGTPTGPEVERPK